MDFFFNLYVVKYGVMELKHFYPDFNKWDGWSLVLNSYCVISGLKDNEVKNRVFLT